LIKIIYWIQRRTFLGWLQLNHQKSRFLVALAGVAFADLLMFMQLGFQGALYDSATRLHQLLKVDLVIVSKQARHLSQMSSFTRRRLYQAMDVPGIKSAEAMYVNNIIWQNPQTQIQSVMLVVGFNSEQSIFDLPEVNHQLKAIMLPDTILFDRTSRGDYKRTISQIENNKTVTTEIGRRTVSLVGLFRVGASFDSDGNLITNDQNFLRLFPSQQANSVNVGLIQLQPGYDPKQVAVALKNQMNQDDVTVMTKQEFIEFEKNFWRESTAIGFIFSLGTSMGFLVGLIIVYQVLSTDVNTHIREYATFKAMGYTNFYLLCVVFEEAVILAMLGFIPGLTISLGLYALTRSATSLPLYMTLARAIQVQVLTILMCMISGAIATRKLQSADPADMF
jgi:putative ABC transport system permease protein